METWLLAAVLGAGLIALLVTRRAGVERPVAPEERAREGHYVFAHRVLPAMLHARPDALDLLRGDDGEDFLHHVWREVNAPLAEPLPPDGLGRTLETAGGREVVLVRLPTPRRSPEAAFVAVVPGPAGLRVLTLELLAERRPGPEPRWVVCEWTAEGTHGNFGVACACTPAAFLAVVAEVVAR